MGDLQGFNDEDALYEMMTQTEDLARRKEIRARIRAIREAREAQRDAEMKQRNETYVDAVTAKLKAAEANKARKMQEMYRLEEEKKARQGLGAREEYIRAKRAQADLDKAQKIRTLNEVGTIISHAYTGGTDIVNDVDLKLKGGLKEDKVENVVKEERGADGSKIITTTQVTTQRTRDGRQQISQQERVITQVGGLGGTSYGPLKPHAAPGRGTQQKSAMSSFKKMDAANKPQPAAVVQTVKIEKKPAPVRKAPPPKQEAPVEQRKAPPPAQTAPPPEKPKEQAKPAPKQEKPKEQPKQKKAKPAEQKKPAQAKPAPPPTQNAEESGESNVTRSPAGIKEALLQWCRRNTSEYEQYGVNITNFSSSWNDGMAFCALIHHFYPKSFDFTRLNPKNRKGNFKLAFDASEKLAGIAPLLDVEDMVRMKNPDWKCVFTYVQQFYRRFMDQDKQESSSGGGGGQTTTTTTVTHGPGGETTTTTTTESAETTIVLG